MVWPPPPVRPVAAPATEDALVHMARYKTAFQFELIVRSYERADPDKAKQAMERYRCRRWFRSRTDDDGSPRSPSPAPALLPGISSNGRAPVRDRRRAAHGLGPTATV